MSPVSRGRRPRNGGKRKSARTRAASSVSPARAIGGGPLTWFDGAVERVLTGSTALASARDGRSLDQRVAELVGAELFSALQIGSGLWFGRWLDEVVDAAVEEAEQGGGAGLVALLHGLAAQGADLSAEVLHHARSRVTDLPDWLAALPRLRATGEVHRLRDTYGTRFGVVAEYVFPGVGSAGWYLWDVDASGFVVLADAGVYDDAEQAAAAWRTRVGDTDPRPAVVDDPAELRCLVELDLRNEGSVHGDEPRRVMDNWFRASARIDVLARALRRQGRPLPAAASLYRGLDVSVLTVPFADWHVRTLGGTPDPEVVEALAAEWMEGALPETWFSASPDRLRFQRQLIGDWVADDPVTLGVVALLPEWARWLGERAGLPADRVDAVRDAAREPAHSGDGVATRR